MTDAVEYQIPARWSAPGQAAPAEIQQLVPRVRDYLLGHRPEIGDGYTLCPVDSVAGHSSIHRLEKGGTGYCVKVYSADRRVRAPREWVGLQIFREFGVAKVPSVYAHFTSQELAFLIMEWVPGTPLGECHLTRPQLESLAGTVQAVHAIGPDTLGESLWSCFWSVEEALRQLPSEIESLKQKPGRHAREAASLAQAWLKSEDPHLVLEPEAPVFSRGDPNLANCLWDGHGLWVVDLEGIGWRDPTLDLALLTEHVQSRQTPHEEWQWFVDQFPLSKRTRRRLLAAQRQDALFWLILACNEPHRVRSLPKEERLDILLDRVHFVCSLES